MCWSGRNQGNSYSMYHLVRITCTWGLQARMNLRGRSSSGRSIRGRLRSCSERSLDLGWRELEYLRVGFEVCRGRYRGRIVAGRFCIVVGLIDQFICSLGEAKVHLLSSVAYQLCLGYLIMKKNRNCFELLQNFH